MSHKLLDITPTPEVLIALTRTPITEIDALSELIDNAIDSFHAARVAGKPTPVQQVLVEIPGVSEVNRGGGLVRVRDTGPGLTEDEIAHAMQAGYSNKNSFDTLGLFGMGFNIATGKLGRVTRVISARAEDCDAVQVVLDIPELQRAQKFTVVAERVAKPAHFTHGTVVEIRNWWPDGDANSRFIRKLAQIPKDTVRERLGRRYASRLRGEIGSTVRISVNDRPCRPFEHCVWGSSRFVETQKYGKIPARIEFDDVVERSRRCLEDATVFGESDSCPLCGSSESREVAQRVRGWVGIQRFDDVNDFGIDLIRNGRVIREAEKAAFFEHADELTGKLEREYPIDQQYGRIVGEVHLDHVPVDFQKQDFQRSTAEWQAAIKFLRGASLLPDKWMDGETNNTPVSRLFQGYRKLRNFGRGHMYMGQYNKIKGRAERVPREIEREYYQKFLDHEPGYYDDSKWWELVESANEPPLDELLVCPKCGSQNTRGAEACIGCDHIFDGKPCRNQDCKAALVRSAKSCDSCGASQVVEVLLPWDCVLCDTANKAGDEQCRTCGSVKGAPHPASEEALEYGAEVRPELGVERLTITLADGKSSDPLDVSVYSVQRPIAAAYGRPPVPLVTYSRSGHLKIYIDLAHSAFTEMSLYPQYLLATEAAQYLYNLHIGLRSRPSHNVAVLTSVVLKQGWGDDVDENADTVRSAIKELFAAIIEKVQNSAHAEDFYRELDDAQQMGMADAMIKSGVDLAELVRMKSTGSYLRYCDRETLASFFKFNPQSWFDGKVWQEDWPRESDMGPVVTERMCHELQVKYLRCLEDAASYLRYEQPERLIVVRARAAVEFLTGKLSQ
ncbi:ATP-binding protein [Nocardia brasiliensis]|uniref:ATP-binding protein n=1 Tax=Nocardia brasiliensis TaxID=37326 RepID=UPI0024557D2B|nr:ATP-binding protein [Nocardia brasiliensis]